MASHDELTRMAEGELRNWLCQCPPEELVEIMVSFVRTFLQDAEGTQGLSPAGRDLSQMSFGEVIAHLKARLDHPEWSFFRVQGSQVSLVSETGSEMGIHPDGARYQAPSGPPARSPQPRPSAARTEPRPGPRPRHGPGADRGRSEPQQESQPEESPAPAGSGRFGMLEID